MRGFSKATIAGNVTRDPELRSVASGTSICTFSVAVNRVSRNSDGSTREEVSYIDVDAWGKQGETISQYVKKGDPILVSGRLRQDTWDDKNGGGKRSRIVIVLEDFCFLGRGGDGSGNYNGGYSGGASASAAPVAPTAAPMNAAAAADAEVPDEIPEEVNLDEVPF